MINQPSFKLTVENTQSFVIEADFIEGDRLTTRIMRFKDMKSANEFVRAIMQTYHAYVALSQAVDLNGKAPDMRIREPKKLYNPPTGTLGRPNIDKRTFSNRREALEESTSIPVAFVTRVFLNGYEIDLEDWLQFQACPYVRHNQALTVKTLEGVAHYRVDDIDRQGDTDYNVHYFLQGLC